MYDPRCERPTSSRARHQLQPVPGCNSSMTPPAQPFLPPKHSHAQRRWVAAWPPTNPTLRRRPSRGLRPTHLADDGRLHRIARYATESISDLVRGHPTQADCRSHIPLQLSHDPQIPMKVDLCRICCHILQFKDPRTWH